MINRRLNNLFSYATLQLFYLALLMVSFLFQKQNRLALTTFGTALLYGIFAISLVVYNKSEFKNSKFTLKRFFTAIVSILILSLFSSMLLMIYTVPSKIAQSTQIQFNYNYVYLLVPFLFAPIIEEIIFRFSLFEIVKKYSTVFFLLRGRY